MKLLRAVPTGAVPVFLILFVGSLVYGGQASGDDTFIYMRYVGNALQGHGYVYNVGEASYGCTSPLWAFIMTPIAGVFGNSVATWKTASAVLFGLRGVILYAALSRLAVTPFLATTLALVTALEPHTFRWAASGMENSLALLLIAFIVQRLMLTGDPRVSLVPSGLAAGLLPFARPELALFAGAIAMLLPSIVTFRQYLIRFLLPAVLAGVSLAAMTWLLFGAIVPQTAEAKALFLHQDMPGYALWQSLKIAGSGCSAFGAFLLLHRTSAREARLLKASAWLALVGAVGYLAFRNQLTSTRYAAFLCGPILTVAAVALAASPSRSRRVRQGIVALQLATSVAMLAYTYPSTRVSEVTDIKRVVDILSTRVRLDDRVALSEIGVFGFFSNVYVVDLVGLTDRATLAWGREHGRIKDVALLENLLRERKATYYVDSFAESTPIAGRTLAFDPIAEVTVERAMLLNGHASRDVWRIYALRTNDRTIDSRAAPGGGTTVNLARESLVIPPSPR